MGDLFMPQSEYWLADDGRVYSGPKQQPVAGTDADYQSHVTDGRPVRSWPRDAEGEQTTYALQDVLSPYEMFADLGGYAADVRWRKETSGILVGGLLVATDDRSKQMIMGARIAAEADSGFTTPWVGSDGSINTLNAAQVIAISNAVLAHVQTCFATFAAVSSEIADETITTRAQVDAAFAV